MSAPTVYKKRVAKLKGELEQLGLDAFVTLNLKNIRYLTGFTGTSAAIVIAGGKPLFVTDFRYATQIKKEVTSMQTSIAKSMKKSIADHLSEKKANNIGYEGNTLTVDALNSIKKLHSGKWKSVQPIETLRTIKDDTEIKLIEKNFKILSKVFKLIPEMIKPGRIERDIAAEMEYRLRETGGDGKAFEFIVASGKRSALPHGVAGTKKIKRGDFVTVDWGCVLDGYHTDNTRNFSVGKPKGKLLKIHEIVLEANLRATEKVADGVPLIEIDFAARDFINKKGFGHRFGHGTGHGVGLDIHEAPNVSQNAENTVAKEGMIFTIEPGIYVPGLGGVRIEDMVLVTKAGSRLLSRSIPKELVII